MLVLLSIGLTAWGRPVLADASYLVLNGKAFHFDARPGGEPWNEENLGLGGQYEFASAPGRPVRFAAGGFLQDSYDDFSWYLGGGALVRRPLGRKYHCDLGLMGFVMRRENIRDGKPFLGALPVASLGTDRVAVNATWWPKWPHRGFDAGAVFLQLKVRLGAP